MAMLPPPLGPSRLPLSIDTSRYGKRSLRQEPNRRPLFSGVFRYFPRDPPSSRHFSHFSPSDYASFSRKPPLAETLISLSVRLLVSAISGDHLVNDHHSYVSGKAWRWVEEFMFQNLQRLNEGCKIAPERLTFAQNEHVTALSSFEKFVGYHNSPSDSVEELLHLPT